MNVKETAKLASKINSSILIFLNKCGLCLENIDYDRHDPEQLFIHEELCHIASLLAFARESINYLSLPILRHGILLKKQNGQYELDGIELTCGMSLEVLLRNQDDDGRDIESWHKTCISLGRDGYFLIGYENQDLAGLPARLRQL